MTIQLNTTGTSSLEEEDCADKSKSHYQKARRAHWDKCSAHKKKTRRASSFYHKLLHNHYRFLIPEGLKVLEVGCGHGDLLASLKPCLGIGIDFSYQMVKTASIKHPHLIFFEADAYEIAFKEKFDVIILSDLINDVWDVQTIFAMLRKITYNRTRIIINFYNNLWRIPLAMVRKLGLSVDVMEQNWFAPHDVFNLLYLSDFDVVSCTPKILLPLPIPLLSGLFNRYLVNLSFFRGFALTNFLVARPIPDPKALLARAYAVSVIIPARNEAGNIEKIIQRIPDMGSFTEIIFVEGNSTDNTYETIKQIINRFPDKNCNLYKQAGKGKGDAVRLGFEKAKGDILMILDADMTVPPEDLIRFYDAIVSGKGEFINGVRLVYPRENNAMRFLNILGNKFFSYAFSKLLCQPIKDTLCGTKVLWKKDYQRLSKNRKYFGDFDPFGDFDLLFGAAKLNFKIAELPIRYRYRTYGDTNINRWQHGWLLLKMVFFAAKRIKFI